MAFLVVSDADKEAQEAAESAKRQRAAFHEALKHELAGAKVKLAEAEAGAARCEAKAKGLPAYARADLDLERDDYLRRRDSIAGRIDLINKEIKRTK